MLKVLKNKKGEGYIETCVGVVVFVMVLVIFINIMSLVMIRQDAEIIADTLLETATATGEFGNAFWNNNSDMAGQYGSYGVSYGAEQYMSGSKVQLGKTMTVSVSIRTYVKGLGVFKIPITVTVRKYGLSERYWKG